MNDTSKTVLRASAPVLALVILALGVRLLPSASGNDDTPTLVRRSPENALRRKPIAPSVPPAPVDTKTQHALQKVVAGQLAAISHKNFTAAINFALPEIRQSWSSDSFRGMLEQGYPSMLSYKRASYAPARMTGDIALLPVTITTDDGEIVSYLYMLRRSNGDSVSPSAEGERPWYVNNVSPMFGNMNENPRHPESSDAPNLQEA